MLVYLHLVIFSLWIVINMTPQADKCADPDLQVSLLAEHEITRLVTLVTAMAQQMGINAAQNPELAELAQEVAPEKVLDTIEAQQRQSAVAEPQSREP